MARFPLLAGAALIAFLPGNGMANYHGTDDTAGTLYYHTTNRLIRVLKRDFKRCMQLDKPYRYDCYDDAYVRGAELLSRNPAYAEAQQALADVGRDIGEIVVRNLDTGKPAVKRGNQTFRPIKESALPEAKAGVVRSIDQAQTVLLRTPDKGDHFARIASALESNKVLLRSALLRLRRSVWRG